MIPLGAGLGAAAIAGIGTKAYLDKKENCPDEFFPYLDDLINPIFERNNIEFTPIEAIFYEIALELGIVKNNDTQTFLSILNQLSKK